MLKGIQLVQVDDSCGGGNDMFKVIESKAATRYLLNLELKHYQWILMIRG